MLLEINPENMDQRLINQVVDILQGGGLIIYPSDSVYSIGCDASNREAIRKLARFKNQKLNKTRFSIICSDISDIASYTKQLSRPVFKVLKHHLPGPFTFILEANNEIPKIFDSKRKEIGIRIPDHPITQAIVDAMGTPLVTSSLHDDEDTIMDYFLDPYQIYERFDKQVDLIIDGGPGKLYASTVVDCTGEDIEVIREGIGILQL
ncbi:MAG: threonylcarbamoyl-AMP synthase [Bacteroidetes bacterium]|nr:MAG: threonylcarbamoyl-AMP synthase [Bacteroidota bacterium]